MTYLERLNAFHQWLESNPLPGNAQLLFFRLLNVFNRAGWPEYVRVDTLRLMLMSDCKTEKSARAARDKLVEAGFIRFEKGKKGAPNAYFLKNTVKKGGENSPETVPESDPETDLEIVPEIDRPIKTKKKTKTKNSTPLIPRQGETGFDGELQSAFEAWVTYKAEKRQGYQPTGLENLVGEIRNSAAKYGSPAVAALIRKCMASNWQGIIFDRLEKAGPPSKAAGSGKAAGRADDYTGARENLARMQKYAEQLRKERGAES